MSQKRREKEDIRKGRNHPSYHEQMHQNRTLQRNTSEYNHSSSKSIEKEDFLLKPDQMLVVQKSILDFENPLLNEIYTKYSANSNSQEKPFTGRWISTKTLSNQVLFNFKVT